MILKMILIVIVILLHTIMLLISYNDFDIIFFLSNDNLSNTNDRDKDGNFS